MATQGTHRSPAETRNRDATDAERADARRETALSVDGVSKSFGTEQAVEDLSLSVRKGELLTLLGPSGCGKTTTLRLVAGLEQPDEGRIELGDRTVTDDETFVAPEERDVGVVFQGFALFPHLTAAENVAFGLEDLDGAERDERVSDLLELVGLADQGEAYPDELSGGQQQRVALARSLAPEPEILLLDEPFSNLDVDLRVEMREEVRRILKESGVTAISVTHDQEEALSISDRVAVMHDGHIEQLGRPEAVFQRPTSRFVAGFLGHASFLTGSVDGDDVETPIATIDRDRIYGFAPEYDDADIDVLVRPDDLMAVSADEEDANGRITYRRYLGPSVLYRVELDSGNTIECMHNHSETLDLDSPVRVTLTADHELAWFPVDA
ncbi:ABC transporter ATP-binding protein [Natronoarchaeum philippinense]|nr:ABC transporter ATP-binding protein [Natronoarchaeum philippinense]